MNKKQLDLICNEFYPRLSKKVVGACRLIILHGVTAYEAERIYKLPPRTAGRYANRILKKFEICKKIADLG